MSDIKEQFKERNKKLVDEFSKIISIIKSDYRLTDEYRGDTQKCDWDIYRLILRNYVNTVLSAPKALEMQRRMEALISADNEDFDSATTELYNHFVNLVGQ